MRRGSRPHQRPVIFFVDFSSQQQEAERGGGWGDLGISTGDLPARICLLGPQLVVGAGASSQEEAVLLAPVIRYPLSKASPSPRPPSVPRILHR